MTEMKCNEIREWVAGNLAANVGQNKAGKLTVKNHYRGAIRMARKLGAISKPEYDELKKFIIGYFDSE